VPQSPQEFSIHHIQQPLQLQLLQLASVAVQVIFYKETQVHAQLVVEIAHGVITPHIV
jgi:hypothetical protein